MTEPHTSTCLYCCQPYRAELFELWVDDRAMMIDSCCEWSHQDILDLDDASFASWFASEAGTRPRRLFYSEQDDALRIDFGLAAVELDQSAVKAFILAHHRHNRPPAGGKFWAGVMNGSDLIGVVMAGRPVARAIDASQVIEVNRVCVRADLEQKLVDRCCSKLYGMAARWAKQNGYSKLITYTRQDEPGHSVMFSGFRKAAAVKGRSWSCKSRPRRSGTIADRWRWELELARPESSPSATAATSSACSLGVGS